jgi:hypothetical protein
MEPLSNAAPFFARAQEARMSTSTSTLTVDAPVKDSKFKELTLKDRCDSCGAAAQGQAIVGGDYLFFCGHHWRKSFDAIFTAGYDYLAPEDEVDGKAYTWATHSLPWTNQFRDAGSAAS